MSKDSEPRIDDFLATPVNLEKEVKPKRLKAKKLQHPAGPFQTSCSSFEKGKMRDIEISKITPAAIVYRFKGMNDEFSLPHGIGMQKAQSLAANIDTGPRSGGLTRSLIKT